jgi:[ribosomal protein S5]-alanine N-acetyltransferase
MTDQTDLAFLSGRSIYCRPLTASDCNREYLAWLNDAEVNRYSRRRYFPTSEVDARRFLDSLGPAEGVLAICLRGDHRHIGNIQFGPIDWLSRHAEIRILIGDKGQWGKGYAAEAIYLMTKHLIREVGLYRVEANSCNPAFIRCVQKLGWTVEGCLRERFHLGGQRIDYLWMSILAREFATIPDYEEILA